MEWLDGKDLIVEAKKPHYDDEIVASVPEKLGAKYVNKIHIRCGDDDALIREHLLAFSDVRVRVRLFVAPASIQRRPRQSADLP